jgi:hypothetical protein
MQHHIQDPLSVALASAATITAETPNLMKITMRTKTMTTTVNKAGAESQMAMTMLRLCLDHLVLIQTTVHHMDDSGFGTESGDDDGEQSEFDVDRNTRHNATTDDDDEEDVLDSLLDVLED